MRALPLALCGAALLCACNPPKDFGNICRLSRPVGNDGGLEFIPKDDPSIRSNFDFLANGDPDCEDLVCLRQAGKDYSTPDGTADATGKLYAHGECSTPCIDATDCGEPARGLTCEKLAFDQSFLDNLKRNDPATYAQYFGDNASALYCTDPGLADVAK